LTVGYVELSQL